MTQAHFRLLASAEQVSWLLLHGTHLAWRPSKSGRRHLYHLPAPGKDFFVELAYTPAGVLYVRRHLVRGQVLASYAHRVRLAHC